MNLIDRSVSAAGALGAMGKFGEMNALAAGGNYQALVCIYLGGGNDGSGEQSVHSFASGASPQTSTPTTEAAASAWMLTSPAIKILAIDSPDVDPSAPT